MTKFRVGVGMDFYSEPYQWFVVHAYDKQQALCKVHSLFPKWYGYRILRVEEADE